MTLSCMSDRPAIAAAMFVVLVSPPIYTDAVLATQCVHHQPDPRSYSSNFLSNNGPAHSVTRRRGRFETFQGVVMVKKKNCRGFQTKLALQQSSGPYALEPYALVSAFRK